MKRKVIKFNELGQNFTVIDRNDVHAIKGGILQPEDPTIQWEWGIDPQGGMYFRQVGSDTWERYQAPLEVNVTGSHPTPPPAGYSGPGGFTYVPVGSDPTYTGSGGWRLR